MTKHKEEMIKGIQDILLNEVEFIRQSDKTLDNKADEIDVIFDTVKFLDKYEENVKVLNKYIEIKRGMER